MQLETCKSRLSIRTTPEIKELLQMAAALKGVSLGTFILGATIEKARQDLKNHTTIRLSREAQLALVHAIQNPGEPTEAMKTLMALPKLLSLS